ncbi:tRNA pseudouridine synthase [Pseudovirgaria hyperparasitica]|uniref:tRNA pseudouridine synthase 1 n=1 Tax=Pseudovirgaria hyperparasitica TaxID=470096 RepID=A0A6A6WMI7_9PEZI|nr:tRNA pseudouridine synthase [Pseudovirgaria hyperparasitica]KAF2763414.1 tRNA pseudouridine synthase [Pseudovirgaria hyperparasitica]
MASLPQDPEPEHRPDRSGKRLRSEKSGREGRKPRASKRERERDAGRGQYFRERTDRRQRNDEEQAKQRARAEAGLNINPMLPGPFSAEEIAAEERKPKRKVAVLVGYSGTGYRGMQISHSERTIEGDLFTAFVEAGAVSKANATDPKKVALVRCARTDKGVHAAGNVISLNMIIEDPNIVEKINEKLNPQIRVWGFERTISSFSCYTLCDSRWYEYLLPTHALLPPRPSSFLGRTLVQIAKEENDLEGYQARQADLKGFWEDFESTTIRPMLDGMDEELRPMVEKVFFDEDIIFDLDEIQKGHLNRASGEKSDVQTESPCDAANAPEECPENLEVEDAENTDQNHEDAKETRNQLKEKALETLDEKQRLKYKSYVHQVRDAYREAHKAFRLSDVRRQRLQEALRMYEGMKRFHNYTVFKSFTDPSVKRHIKSFVASEPFEKHGSEWISLKVHGQSFMMHQIRKMVGMAVLAVRCGSPLSLLEDSFTDVRLSIPKAPGLGLLLERPVFETYNNKHAKAYDKGAIDFSAYEKPIEEFKQQYIYEHIWHTEEEKGEFRSFFKHVDCWTDREFLFLSSKGVDAVKGLYDKKGKSTQKQTTKATLDSDDEGDAGDG